MKNIITYIQKLDITLLLSIALILSKPNDNFGLLTVQLIVLTIIVIYWIVKAIILIRDKVNKK